MSSPNSAFAEICDNETKYYTQSIGILIFTSILAGFVLLPFFMIPFDESYFADVDDVGFPANELDVILVMGSGVLGGVVSAGLLYFIGKKIGGNNNWKKVFTVFFHTYVPTIPLFIIIFILFFLMLDSFTEIDPLFFQMLSGDEDKILSLLGPTLGYMGMLVLVTIVFVIWLFIISVKAVKILNGFGTGKAFGLIILVMFITSIVTFPFGL